MDADFPQHDYPTAEKLAPSVAVTMVPLASRLNSILPLLSPS